MKPRRDLVRRLYWALLRLYPTEFRERFGPDLRQAFDDRRCEPRFSGTIGGLRLVLFLTRDFVTSVPMAYRDHNTNRVGEMMGEFFRDLRFSVRMLVKDPMFTVAAVMTLALGIGLNAATFSTVNGILLAPLSGVDDSEELIQMYREWPGIPFGSNSVPHFQDLRDRTTEVFENVSTYTFSPMSLVADGRSERVIGMIVGAAFFQTYDVQPALGRAFLPGEEDVGPGAHPIVVLGHGFWQSRFGGRADIVGTTLSLNGTSFEVVGVAPPDFYGPVNFADIPIYAPLMMLPVLQPGSTALESRGSNSMTVVGRLRDGQSIERAEQVLQAVLRDLGEEYPGSYENQTGTRLVAQDDAGIHPSMAGAQKGMSAVMMVVVGLLLLIACVNVANLFLARARDRRKEMGIRLSLGAGRGRIIRQLLTESMLFSALAGLVGLIIAVVAVRLLAGYSPPMEGPWRFNVVLDHTVLWFTLGVSALAGLVFGMAPALQSARPDTLSAVKGEATEGGSRSRVSSFLVIVQMALSLLLLITSGLFIRSLQGAMEIDPGFDSPSSLALASLDPGLQGYDEARAKAFFDRLKEDILVLPQVTNVAFSNALPLAIGNSDRGVTIPGYEFAEGEGRNVYYTQVSEGFMETMGIDILSGRSFTMADDENAAPVVIVNQQFADRFWPGQPAIGKIVETAGAERTVIGVVQTGKYQSLGEDPAGYMYFPSRERFQSAMTVIARVQGDPQEALRQLRGLVRAADETMPVYDVQTMEDHMGVALLPARIGGGALGLFGLLGLILASVGIYGVMAYSVAQRKRELGIRVALGADRGNVQGLFLREGLRLAVIGTVFGLMGAAGTAHLVKGLLYNVEPFDPVAFTVVPALLLAVAALAVYIPARRAAGLDPMRALKAD